MTKSYITHLINDMSYEERSRLVIKIAKMRKLGIYQVGINSISYVRITGSRVYLMTAWEPWYSGSIDVFDLNLHYDVNIMKLEDIGYMLQKNNRRHLWT